MGKIGRCRLALSSICPLTLAPNRRLLPERRRQAHEGSEVDRGCSVRDEHPARSAARGLRVQSGNSQPKPSGHDCCRGVPSRDFVAGRRGVGSAVAKPVTCTDSNGDAGADPVTHPDAVEDI
jgi:hypothetical protein